MVVRIITVLRIWIQDTKEALNWSMLTPNHSRWGGLSTLGEDCGIFLASPVTPNATPWESNLQQQAYVPGCIFFEKIDLAKHNTHPQAVFRPLLAKAHSMWGPWRRTQRQGSRAIIANAQSCQPDSEEGAQVFFSWDTLLELLFSQSIQCIFKVEQVVIMMRSLLHSLDYLN